MISDEVKCVVLSAAETITRISRHFKMADEIDWFGLHGLADDARALFESYEIMTGESLDEAKAQASLISRAEGPVLAADRPHDGCMNCEMKSSLVDSINEIIGSADGQRLLALSVYVKHDFPLRHSPAFYDALNRVMGLNVIFGRDEETLMYARNRSRRLDDEIWLCAQSDVDSPKLYKMIAESIALETLTRDVIGSMLR